MKYAVIVDGLIFSISAVKTIEEDHFVMPNGHIVRAVDCSYQIWDTREEAQIAKDVLNEQCQMQEYFDAKRELYAAKHHSLRRLKSVLCGPAWCGKKIEAAK